MIASLFMGSSMLLSRAFPPQVSGISIFGASWLPNGDCLREPTSLGNQEKIEIIASICLIMF